MTRDEARARLRELLDPIRAAAEQEWEGMADLEDAIHMLQANLHLVTDEDPWELLELSGWGQLDLLEDIFPEDESDA